MIIEVNECYYMGILIDHVDRKGWKCILGDYEYLFHTLQDAQAAIREVFKDITPIVDKYKGVKFKK